MKLPIVSIIVPTYNSAGTLEACLRSLKEQTYDSIEIIVVDNSSTDATKELAQQFTKKVFNQGPERSAQRNFGVKKAEGEYVVIIDSDMELSPKVIAACVEKVKADSSFGGVIIPEESFGTGFWAQCKRRGRLGLVAKNWGNK
jgi:glycosyltransferase involved in cell wall biosynthesis